MNFEECPLKNILKFTSVGQGSLLYSVSENNNILKFFVSKYGA